MPDLGDRRDIQTCREHHANIEGILGRLPPLAPENASDLEVQLTQLKSMLLRHLKFEDDRLYPRLLAAGDPEVVATAARYQAEMGGLASVCVAFFTRWATTDAIAAAFDTFASEWQNVRTALERRILAEDNELYELAERR